MATATAKITATVYTLTLSAEEAQTLADLLAKIGGSHQRSRRKHTAAISQALSAAGIRFDTSPYAKWDGGIYDGHTDLPMSASTNIYFADSDI